MGLQSDYGVIIDSTFQGRCWVALMQCAGNVLNNVVGYPAAGQAALDPADDDAYAKKILRKEVGVDLEVLANFVIQNSTVAAAPTTDTTEIDNAIRWELNNVSWGDLRDIG